MVRNVRWCTYMFYARVWYHSEKPVVSIPIIQYRNELSYTDLSFKCYTQDILKGSIKLEGRRINAFMKIIFKLPELSTCVLLLWFKICAVFVQSTYSLVPFRYVKHIHIMLTRNSQDMNTVFIIYRTNKTSCKHKQYAIRYQYANYLCQFQINLSQVVLATYK